MRPLLFCVFRNSPRLHIFPVATTQNNLDFLSCCWCHGFQCEISQKKVISDSLWLIYGSVPANKCDNDFDWIKKHEMGGYMIWATACHWNICVL